MEENATASNPQSQYGDWITNPNPKMNCSDLLVKSHPDDVVKEVGKQIIVLYVYAAFVVSATFVLYLK